MAAITPAPILLATASLQIGADTYELAASKMQLTPTTPVQTFKGLGGNVVPVVGVPSWMLDLDYAQDPAALTSLSEVLRVNAGQTVVAIIKPFKPATGTAATYTISVILLPGAIGGAVDAIATSSVSLPAIGQPVRTVA